MLKKENRSERLPFLMITKRKRVRYPRSPGLEAGPVTRASTEDMGRERSQTNGLIAEKVVPIMVIPLDLNLPSIQPLPARSSREWKK